MSKPKKIYTSMRVERHVYKKMIKDFDPDFSISENLEILKMKADLHDKIKKEEN